MTLATVHLPVVDLLNAPGGRRERQLLCGAEVELRTHEGEWCSLRAMADGYEGWARARSVGIRQDATRHATHVVIARATHAYSAPDLKSPERCALSMGSLLCVTGQKGRFWDTDQGYVPLMHLQPRDGFETDPVAVAEQLLGTPYLWGGNSSFGIDCSGLVQMACRRCGIDCPGDSGPQERSLGKPLAPGTAAQRGDLLFWPGHVAWVLDQDTLLHANAYHMAVAKEPMQAAIARISAQGDGEVTAHKRLLPLT